MGAPVGNQNAARAKVWRAAIERALARRTARREDGQLEIDVVADALIDAAIGKDVSALKEIGDRLDGKVPQGIIGGDEGDPALSVVHKITLGSL